MGFLNVEGVVAGYTAADEILKGLDFALRPGEIVCVIGPNGAGKSTLLKAIAGLVTPSRGAITFKEKSLVGLAPRDITRLGVAYVPQEHNVFPSMSVIENLEIGGYIAPARVPERMSEVLARFPVLANKRRHTARTLSGGERQILAMAMALMVEPELLLLDEPSAGLAPAAAERLFEEVRAVNRDRVAIVLVEQNASEALAVADRAYILIDGRTSRSGEARWPPTRRSEEYFSAGENYECGFNKHCALPTLPWRGRVDRVNPRESEGIAVGVG
jgi:branched-chain amino acid transport system ATP-binding protein/neutral amino acid transport system ATP-binding protein